MKTTIKESKRGKACKPSRIPLSEKMTTSQVQNAYNKVANQYEKKIWFDQHVLGVARLRKKLFSKATGNVLEVACGTGQNFSYLPVGVNITATELSPNMLQRAREHAKELNLKINFAVMDAENLEFPDASFDTVISSLSTCTFPNPIKALQEIKRLCRPNGLILLLEHGHSNLPFLAKYQDRHEYQHYQDHAGCRWNQDPLDLIESAGLKVIKSKRSILGLFHSIEATPSGVG